MTTPNLAVSLKRALHNIFTPEELDEDERNSKSEGIEYTKSGEPVQRMIIDHPKNWFLSLKLNYYPERESALLTLKGNNLVHEELFLKVLGEFERKGYEHSPLSRFPERSAENPKPRFDPKTEVVMRVQISDQKSLDRLLKDSWEAIHGKQQVKTSSDLYDTLLSAEIPEEVIEGNEELCTFLQDVRRNDVVSQNRSFYVIDKDGNRLLLKITGNRAKARMEAAANYYLSSYLRFIAPGKFPEPLEANGLYLTLQKDISGETPGTAVEMPLDYWIGAFAMFHREAEKILQEEGVNIREVTFRSIDHQVERYSRGRKKNDLQLDPVRLKEAIDYLQSYGSKVLIHNDAKNGNLVGRYLVDLELCGKGHPAIDLALLFMQYGVSEAEWGVNLRKYLAARGITESYNDELKNLKEGMGHAVYYTAAREIIGSSLREVRKETVKDNLELLRHINP